MDYQSAIDVRKQTKTESLLGPTRFSLGIFPRSDIVAHTPLVPVLRRQKQVDACEFEASQG